MPICSNCGNQTADNAIFCDQCGHKLPTPEIEQAPAVEAPAGSVPEGVLVCPECSAENVPGEVFCDVCGNPLEAPVPAAEETVVEAQPIPEEQESPYCPTCGVEVKAEDTFCGSCGAALGTAPAEDEVVPVEPILEEPEAEGEPVEETVIEEEVIEEVVEEEPVEEVIVEEVVIEEEPIEEVIVEEVVIEEEPIEEVIAEEVAVEEEPIEPITIEEEPIEEVVVVEEVVVEEEPAEEGPRCPVCGVNVLPAQAFCASCGAELQPVEEAAPEPVAEPAAATGPYFEVVDSGAHIPLLDQPELVIGRADEVSGIYPDVDMTPHGGEEGGVSRRHGRLIHERDAWFVIDMDSTNGTLLNGHELTPETRTPLNDGDTLTLGDVEIVFHIA